MSLGDQRNTPAIVSASPVCRCSHAAIDHIFEAPDIDLSLRTFVVRMAAEQHWTSEEMRSLT
jgi:hypothetical protein